MKASLGRGRGLNEGKEVGTRIGLGQILPLKSQEESGFNSTQKYLFRMLNYIRSKRIQTGPTETNKWDGR